MIMGVKIHGFKYSWGEFLTGALDVISQSLTLLVLIILLLIVIISIIILGGVIAEYTSRNKVPVGTIKRLNL